MLYPRIKELREENKLSQIEVSEFLHCTQAAYCFYENGKRDIPTSVLISLSSLYHCSTDYILGISNIK